MGMPEFSRRWEFGQHLIRANGVTYNVYGDPLGSARPWPMDLVPLAIDGHEWAQIERAVAQRATLLNAVLAEADPSVGATHAGGTVARARSTLGPVPSPDSAIAPERDMPDEGARRWG